MTVSVDATVLHGGRVLCPAGPAVTALAVADGVITWVGTDDEAAARFVGARFVSLDGSLVTPAFVDAHVHATGTGLARSGLDLTGCGSTADCLAAVRAYAAAHDDAVIWGHGWQETAWAGRRVPSRVELDDAAGGRPLYLSRIDVHSALVSNALVALGPDARTVDGWDETGAVSRQAHHVLRGVARQRLGAAQREAAQRAFLRAAAAAGIASVHECAGPDVSGADDLSALLALGADTSVPEVVGYWGAWHDIDTARRVGARGVGGDLFVDGAIGSRTASLCAPYTDDPGNHGARYADATAIAEHLVACTEAGMQGGFHVIGDAAVAEVVAGVRAAAAAVGVARFAACRHRVEHLEMVTAAQAGALAAHGVVASVQPMFDAAWGGRSGMYAERLGERGSTLNPFAEFLDTGLRMAFGSDSPVTALGPWAAVRAAARHRTPRSAIPVAEAVAAHTVGGRHAAHDDTAGALVPGAPAHYAVWDARRVPEPDDPLPRCLRTARAGVPIHDTGELDR